MDFIISRTSIWSFQYEDKSSEEIIKMLDIPTDFNIKIENIYDKYDDEYKRAIISLNSIEDLTKLQDKVGELILTKNRFRDLYEIEIYDDYREWE